jgi:hypothetical protein
MGSLYADARKLEKQVWETHLPQAMAEDRSR